MKTKLFFTILLASMIWFTSCKTTQDTSLPMLTISLVETPHTPNLNISFYNGESYNYPTFALWIENLEGDYIKTIYVTKSYASGIFGHELVGDSIWKKTPGPSFQPAALPYWSYKKGLIDGEHLIPTPEHPFVDAYTGATPEQNFELKTSTNLDNKFKILLEVNQSWDWNEYWTNDKFPESKAYSYSAQPSLIYEVEINNEHEVFYMNPVGHSDPKGENGKLYSNISTLTTAKGIFKMIKVESLKN